MKILALVTDEEIGRVNERFGTAWSIESGWAETLRIRLQARAADLDYTLIPPNLRLPFTVGWLSHFLATFHAKSARLRETGQPFSWLTCEYLVEHRGIEPLTSGLQTRTAPFPLASLCSGCEDNRPLTCVFFYLPILQLLLSSSNSTPF